LEILKEYIMYGSKKMSKPMKKKPMKKKAVKKKKGKRKKY